MCLASLDAHVQTGCKLAPRLDLVTVMRGGKIRDQSNEAQ
jgi:hypothetical protein